MCVCRRTCMRGSLEPPEPHGMAVFPTVTRIKAGFQDKTRKSVTVTRFRPTDMSLKNNGARKMLCILIASRTFFGRSFFLGELSVRFRVVCQNPLTTIRDPKWIFFHACSGRDTFTKITPEPSVCLRRASPPGIHIGRGEGRIVYKNRLRHAGDNAMSGTRRVHSIVVCV